MTARGLIFDPFLAKLTYDRELVRWRAELDKIIDNTCDLFIPRLQLANAEKISKWIIANIKNKYNKIYYITT